MTELKDKRVEVHRTLKKAGRKEPPDEIKVTLEFDVRDETGMSREGTQTAIFQFQASVDKNLGADQLRDQLLTAASKLAQECVRQLGHV